MIALALTVAAATLAIGLAATFLLRLLPTVRLQLAGLALLAVALPLAAVLLSGWVMFHMGDDVKILAVAAASALVAVAAALVLGTSIARRIDRLRSASGALAAGDLSARAPDSGPRELAELGRSFNEMAANLEGLFDARRELVAAASHDLRTPIASITAMLEAIEDGLAKPEEYLARTPGSGSPPRRARRGPLRARADRRRGARPRAALDLARAARGVVRARLRGRGARPERPARAADRGDPRRTLCPRGGRARPPEPAHERAPPHTFGRDRRGDSRTRRRSGPGDRGGHRRWADPRGGAPDVRPLLARRLGPGGQDGRCRARARDRARPGRGPGRTDLGRAARGRRREGVVHAAGAGG